MKLDAGIVGLGTLLLMGGTAGADSLFTLTPCRVFDTRSTLTPLTGTQLVTLTEGTCGVPIWASAVAANVTLINPTVNVSLGFVPGDLAPTGTNVVSAAPGAVRAGCAVLPLATDQSGTVLAFPTFASPGQTDLAIDVSGYFAPDNAGTPLKGQAQMYSQGGEGDPGGAGDPRLDSRPNTLGRPMLPSTNNPARLGGPSGPTAAVAFNPIGIDRVTGRYFVDHGAIKVLVGASSDAACHLHLATNGDICTFDSSQSSWYVNVLSDAASKGLNKIRLWVALNGGNWQSVDPTCTALLPPYHDQPFRYHPTPAGPNGIGYWYLDQQNIQFFKNLKAVVEFAKQQGIYVEVTFFAPWVGIWELGPWHPDHARLSTSPGTPLGFTDRSYFVKLDPSNGGVNANEAMRAYQMQVMHWTVDTLWNYENIYWEIANEPENYAPASTGCGAPTPQSAIWSDVAPWQNTMINDLAAYEQTNYVNTGLLARPHVIAVQPFSREGTNVYVTNGNVGVINGHYTTVSLSRGNMGAIDLARGYANQAKILGFNEGKISGINSDGSTNNTGTANGGQPDSARAEAWEFMLYQGGTFDHFGYFYSSPNGQQVRQQLGALKSFLSSLALRQVTTSPDPPSWVNIGQSPYSTPGTVNNKFWAALEPSATATIIQYALYIHHSQPRFTDGIPSHGFLNFGGYQPIFGSYQESLRLCLGSQPGTFLVQWINPATNTTIGSAQTIQWAGSTTCANGGPGSVAITTPSSYSYDVGLLVQKQ